MRRALLGLAMAALVPTAARAQRPEAPERQVAFEALMQELTARSRAAPNDAARLLLRQELTRRLLAENFRSPRGWVGNIVRVSAGPTGLVTVVINLLRSSAVLANVIPRQGREFGRPINPDSPLVRTAAQLRMGEMVRFDAEFSCAMENNRPTLQCPMSAHEQHSGALEMPIFLVTFSRLAALD